MKYQVRLNEGGRQKNGCALIAQSFLLSLMIFFTSSEYVILEFSQKVN